MLMMSQFLGLYVHVPFCARRCPYCDFAIHIGNRNDFASQYVEALKRELQSVLRASSERRLDSVFFGGGTPTFLPAQTLVDLLNLVKQEIEVANDAEISIEANPENLCAGFDLDLLRRGGFNRISLGAQSFDDQALKRIGRVHTSTHIEEAFHKARAAGFENISLDLMFALPGQNRQSWRETLNRALRLQPEHLSCYSLTIEPETNFARRVQENRLTIAPDDEQAAMMNDAYEIAREFGVERYEVSNYARRGFECAHNLNYWRGGNYLAAGCGAHGHRNGHRWWNERDAKSYVLKMQQGSAQIGQENLTSEQQLAERVMLGVRLREGFDVESASRDLDIDARALLSTQIGVLQRQNLLLDDGKVLRLPPEVVPIADAVAAKLLP